MFDGAAFIVPGSNLGSATTAQGSGSVNRSSKDPFGHDALVRLSQSRGRWSFDQSAC